MAPPAARAMVPLAAPPNAKIAIPGSKSLTNRALVLASLAHGTSLLTNTLAAADTAVMVEALRRLGIAIETDEWAGTMRVQGRDGEIPATSAELYVGGAGTAARFLIALVCLGHGWYRLDGDARMRQRPMADLVTALRSLGARVADTNGSLPITVEADGLPGGRAAVSGEISSQFLSALLMVAPYAASDVQVTVEGRLVAAPYVEMTIAVMAAFGVEVERDGIAGLRTAAGDRYGARTFEIEPDASSAAYFFAAAAITGGRVTVPGLSAGSLQGDTRFIDVLEQMGCRVERRRDEIAVAGPQVLRGIDVDLGAMSDQTLTLAAIAPFAEGPTRIRGVAHIRYQESDRLAALATELRRLGQDVEERPDGLIVHPRPVKPATIQTYGDHRVAMAFAVTGLRAAGIAIAGPGCVTKTFPDFFERLERLRIGSS